MLHTEMCRLNSLILTTGEITAVSTEPGGRESEARILMPRLVHQTSNGWLVTLYNGMFIFTMDQLD